MSKKKEQEGLQPINNFVIFKTESGKVNIDVFYQDKTLWLTQKKIAELFEKGRSTITEHLKKIFSDGELDKKVVCREFRHTTKHGAIEGKTQEQVVTYYNLSAITAVGYRVNSQRAIEFRKWATEVLHEYIIKGFTMDDERLKQIKHFGEDYFDEMLERIREIRLSERRLYQKITDIKSDVSIAKNYLNTEHIRELERIVISYLDLAENRARNRQVMNMKDWDSFLVQFLELADYPILKDKGKISMLEAKLKAESEYDKFRVIQDRLFESDFDRMIKNQLTLKGLATLVIFIATEGRISKTTKIRL